jgi:hypothetical protein
MGILEEVTGQRQDRRVMYREYVGFFSADGDDAVPASGRQDEAKSEPNPIRPAGGTPS